MSAQRQRQRQRQDPRSSRFGSTRNWIVAGVLLAAVPAVAQDGRRPTPEALAHPGPGSRIDVALAFLLVSLVCALFIYLSHALVATQ